MASTMAALRDRVHALMPQARSDLAELVACKSVADPRQFPASECLKAAQLVIDRLARKQYEVEPRAYEGRLLHQLPAVRTPSSVSNLLIIGPIAVPPGTALRV